MKSSIKALLVATVLALPVAAPVFAQDDTSTMSMGHSMLTGAVVNSLNRMGIDASNVGDLSLNQVAQIRGILENSDTPTNQMAMEINSILGN